MFKPIHKHLLIKAKVLKFYEDPDKANSFLRNLVDLIGMVPVTHPQSVYVKDLGNEGLTGSINLATSHIAYHHWQDKGLLMLDVYSCKDFDEQIILNKIEEDFQAVEIKHLVIDRDLL